MRPQPTDDFFRRQVVPLAYRQLPAEELFARAVAGDAEAFVAFVCLKYPLVAGVTYSALGRAEPFDDVIQEVFVELWRQREAVRSPAAVDGWLAQTARNIALKNAAREAKRHKVHEDWWQQNVDVRADSGQPDTAAIQNEIVRRVRQVLAEQSEDDQRVLRAAEKSDRDAEAADSLGLSVPTYRVRLHRARRRLRDLLTKYGITPVAAVAAFLSGRKARAAAVGALLVLGGIVFGVMWATSRPTPLVVAPPDPQPAPPPAVAVATLQERNLRIVKDELASPLRDLMQRFYPPDNPVVLTGVRAFGSEVEIEFKLTRPVPAITGMASQMRGRYCTFRRKLVIHGQPDGEQKWYTMNPEKPYVIPVPLPIGGPVELVLGREEYKAAERLFARLPPDPRAQSELLNYLFGPRGGELLLPATTWGMSSFPGGLLVMPSDRGMFVRDGSGAWRHCGECPGWFPVVAGSRVYCAFNGISSRPLDDPSAAWMKWCDPPLWKPGERSGVLCAAGGRLYMAVDPNVFYSISLTDPSAGWNRAAVRHDYTALAAVGETLFWNDGKELFAGRVTDPTALASIGKWPEGCHKLVADGDRLLAFGDPGPIYARPATRKAEEWVIVGRVHDPDKR